MLAEKRKKCRFAKTDFLFISRKEFQANNRTIKYTSKHIAEWSGDARLLLIVRVFLYVMLKIKAQHFLLLMFCQKPSKDEFC